MLGFFIVDDFVLLGLYIVYQLMLLGTLSELLGACKRLFDVHLSMIGIVYVGRLHLS